MRLTLSPYHFLEIVIGRNNNPVFLYGPIQNLIVTHLGVLLTDFDYVMPLVNQPLSHNPTCVNIQQEVHED